MASSRPMRRSAVSRPQTPSVVSNNLPEEEKVMERQENGDPTAWTEPPPRQPVPSFEDYKGLERHGVLEHMAPLGTLPNSKVRARIRQHEPVRRVVQLRNGDARGVRDEPATPDPPPAMATRRSTSARALESRQTPVASGRRKGEERENGAGGRNTTAKSTPALQVSPTASSRPATQPSSPSTIATPSQTATRGPRWHQIVQAAVKRAQEVGNPTLGGAIQKIYDESLQSQSLAKLLEAILSRHQTPEQTAEFTLYIRAERKRLKKDAKRAQQRKLATSSSSPSHHNIKAKSPSSAKTLLGSATRQLETMKDETSSTTHLTLPPPSHMSPSTTTTTTTTSNHHPPHSRNKPRHHLHLTVNGTPSKDGRPSKRMKRSRSGTSDSTLSSAESALSDLDKVEQDVNLNGEILIPALSPPNSQPGAGPPLGTFSTGRTSTATPTPDTTTIDTNSPEAKIAARRRIPRSFDGLTVNESSVRRALVPRSSPNKPPAPTSTPNHHHHQKHDAQQQQPSRVQPSRRHTRQSAPLPDPTPDPTPAAPPSATTATANATDTTAPATTTTGPAKASDTHANAAAADALDSANSSQSELTPPPPERLLRALTPSLRLEKRAARIKQSPLKKRNGVTAGIAQPVEPAHSQALAGRSEDDTSDGTEICSACSGNGTLILCDTCSRGYHFTCCDPPFSAETKQDDLPETWYCRRCAHIHAADTPLSKEAPRIWKELYANMSFKNPISFNLPRYLREYFEGVHTGEEGEYEELHNVKISRARAGYEEQPDNFKIRDRKDNLVLCFRCGRSATGRHELAACDYCNLSWHLDCLDPPLSSAPNRKTVNGKPRGTWMCPNHADHEILAVTASASSDGHRTLHTATSSCRSNGERVFRTRRPKKISTMEISLSRGVRNYGMIEIEADDSEEESEIEREMSGVVYKVPEKGIKLDFIDRIRQANAEQRQYDIMHPLPTSPPTTTKVTDLDARPFKERKAALNLAQLAQRNGALDADRVQNLIDTLTAEAPANVESLVNESENALTTSVLTPPPSNGTGDGNGAGAGTEKKNEEQEKEDLEKLIALAQRRLQAVSGSGRAQQDGLGQGEAIKREPREDEDDGNADGGGGDAADGMVL